MTHEPDPRYVLITLAIGLLIALVVWLVRALAG